MALIDTNLIVRYYCDEAASGTTPTDLLDASGVGDDFDLAINYGTDDANYFEDGSGNRAWEITDFTGGPVARKAIVGSDKIDDLDGVSQKLTIELVILVNAGNSDGGRIFGITDSGGEGSFMVVHFDGAGADNVQIRWNEFNDTFTMPKGARAVWHIVVDSTLGTQADRVKVYKDGSFQESPNPGVSENETIAIAASSFLCVGNRANDGNRGANAEFYYAALYDGAFSAQDCSDNYDVLTADDDTPSVGEALVKIISEGMGIVESSVSLSVPVGSVCWGHVTGVTQDLTRTFATNWTGTGTISGSGDSEIVKLTPGQYVESEVVNVGVGTANLTLDEYQSGEGVPIVKYKDGDSVANCEADTWNTYTAPFVSQGYVKIRLEK